MASVRAENVAEVLWELKLPAALPSMLAGLKIAGGLALIGAVVAEFVAGTGGTASVYALSTVLELAFLAALGRVRYLQPPAPAPSRRSWRDMLAGAEFIWRRKVILGASSLDLFAVLLGGATKPGNPRENQLSGELLSREEEHRLAVARISEHPIDPRRPHVPGAAWTELRHLLPERGREAERVAGVAQRAHARDG